MDGAQALGLELRKEMFLTAQAIQERLGDPPARVGVAQLETLTHAHDAFKAHHDTELYSLIPLANRFMWNRRSVSVKVDSLYRVRLLVFEGPSDGHSPITTGFDVLVKEHGMALFPEDANTAYEDLIEWAQERGVPVTFMSTIPLEWLMNTLDAEPGELLATASLDPCPYCKHDVPKVRTRVPRHQSGALAELGIRYLREGGNNERGGKSAWFEKSIHPRSLTCGRPCGPPVVLELFCAESLMKTAVSEAKEDIIHIRVDYMQEFNPTFCVDILKWAQSGQFRRDLRTHLKQWYDKPWVDVLFATPDCTKVSQANWRRPPLESFDAQLDAIDTIAGYLRETNPR